MKHTNFIEERTVSRGGTVITSYRTVEVDVAKEDEVHGNPEVVVSEDEDGYLVTFDWSKVADVDHPNNTGILVDGGVKGQRFVERITRATAAGVLFENAHRATARDGSTYVQATMQVMGKYLNADLKRLGF